MKKCVEALAASNDNLDEAVTILRKAGVSAAAKKAGRGASEGAVALAHTSDGSMALIELNSETDFVARNEIFQALAVSVARSALGCDTASTTSTRPVDVATIGVKPLNGGDGASVTEALGVAVSQLGENLVLRRACLLQAPNAGGVVASYVHNAYAKDVGRTAAAVVLASTADPEALRALGQKLAMHVVAAAPRFLNRESVDAAAIERERSILLEQAHGSGKPANVIEKMVEGRLNKFFSEVCFVDQEYLIEESAGSISKVLAAAGKELGTPVELTAFARYSVGETLHPAE